MFMMCLICQGAIAQQTRVAQIDREPFEDNARHWYGIADSKNMINALPGHPRFKPTEVREIADNILLFQKVNGGWPKNYDMFAKLTRDQQEKVRAARQELNTTFDNGTGYTQIKALAIAFKATGDNRYRQGALEGLNFVLAAQYANGGWPQYFPLQSNYSRHITFNDGVFEGIIRLLKDIATGNPLYDFVELGLRKKISGAYKRGIECILKTQIMDDGRLTAWCQQHDEVTLAPAWARKFEPPSICNGESAGIVLFLMSLDQPDSKVVNAVQSAVRWFEDSRIYHTRVQTIKADSMLTPYRISATDRVVVFDSSAPPIWTRYYELKTHRPIFCNRDGRIVYSLAEVERERRDGYAWYTYAPQKVLDSYPRWRKKIGYGK
jgi:PelA/Pel-15E family pectate lyase